MADFGVTEYEHPDEVPLPGTHILPMNSGEKPQTVVTGPGVESDKTSAGNTSGPSKSMHPPSRNPMTRSSSLGQQPTRYQPQTPQATNRPGPSGQGRPQMQHNGRSNGSGPPAQISAAQGAANSRTNTPPPANGSDQFPDGQIAFFSARSVNTLPEGAPPGSATLPQNGGKLFDPKLESPSIRKTPGIDHQSTKPVSKERRHVAPVQREDDSIQKPGGTSGNTNGSARLSLGNVVNPSLNQARQIGAPGNHSPMGNRGQYKPPTMAKRPADAAARPPLNDMTTNSNVGGGSAGADAKRQKVG
jgi:DNA repair and recombination protein RAD52